MIMPKSQNYITASLPIIRDLDSTYSLLVNLAPEATDFRKGNTLVLRFKNAYFGNWCEINFEPLGNVKRTEHIFVELVSNSLLFQWFAKKKFKHILSEYQAVQRNYKYTEERIVPPWIKYPQYAPCDFFWRQSGELYFQYVWQPFWMNADSLTKVQILKEFPMPRQWQSWYSMHSILVIPENIEEPESFIFQPKNEFKIKRLENKELEYYIDDIDLCRFLKRPGKGINIAPDDIGRVLLGQAGTATLYDIQQAECNYESLTVEILVSQNTVFWLGFNCDDWGSYFEDEPPEQQDNRRLMIFAFDRTDYINTLESLDGIKINNITEHGEIALVNPTRYKETLITSPLERKYSFCFDGKNYLSFKIFLNTLLEKNDTIELVSIEEALLDYVCQNSEFLDEIDTLQADTMIRSIGSDPYWDSSLTYQGRNILGLLLMRVRDKFHKP
jgi:hypothetical protein